MDVPSFRAPVCAWLLVLPVTVLVGLMVPMAFVAETVALRAVAVLVLLGCFCAAGFIAPALSSGARRGRGAAVGRDVVVAGARIVELGLRAGLLVAPLLSLVAGWAFVEGFRGREVGSGPTELKAMCVLALVSCLAFPTTFRLLTGRLPRRRLVLGADGLTERGWRGERAVRWREIEAVEVDPRSRAILLVTAEEDVVLAWTYYRVDPAWLYDELSRRARRAAP